MSHSKPSHQKRIAHIIYHKDDNSYRIVKQDKINDYIDNDYDILVPNLNAINQIRSKSVDWEITNGDQTGWGTEAEGGYGNRTEANQYKNWTINFGKMDVRIIPNIHWEILYRQVDEGIEDGVFFQKNNNQRIIWEVGQDGTDTYRVKDVKLHIATYLGGEGTIIANDKPYEVKLLIDIINPLDFV